MDEQQIVNSIIQDIQNLPGYEYLKEIISDDPDFPFVGINPQIVIKSYLRNKLSAIKMLLRALIDRANPNAVKDVSDQMLKLLAESKDVGQLVDDVKVANLLVKQPFFNKDTPYLSKFLLTGENDEPKKLKDYIVRLAIDPSTLSDTIKGDINGAIGNYIQLILSGIIRGQSDVNAFQNLPAAERLSYFYDLLNEKKNELNLNTEQIDTIIKILFPQ